MSELAVVQERLRRWRRIGDRTLTTTPLFLLVTPLGMGLREDIRWALAGMGIRVLARQPLPCYAQVASAVYARFSNRQAARRSLAYEEAWREVAPDYGSQGECWWLSPTQAHVHLDRVKRELRRALAEETRFRLGRRNASLHAFHVSDPGDLACEGARLRAAL